MKQIFLLPLIAILSFTYHKSYGQSIADNSSNLEAYLRSQNFSGAVLTIDSNGNEISVASGFNDIDESQAIDVNAKFKIASITKLFTTVMVMQLVDEEKLSLSTKVGEVLQNSDITNASKISIKNLLQHTSGLKKESRTSFLSGYSADEMIEKFATKKASFKPGNDIQYNNVDFIIAGKVIEKLTGKSFAENLTERIIDPLQLKNTGLLIRKELPADITPAFQIQKGKKKEEFKIHIENFGAAGSMYSTIQDLVSFTKALKSEKLLSAKAKESLFDSNPKLGYVALGCWTFKSPFIANNPKVLERRGGILGSTSVIMTSLDGPETLIVLSNTDGFNPDTFGQAENMKEYLFKQLFTANH
ncbi:serine hydrolase domain-containing protein [Roseivirga sp.]|uniref:serine hydrolase domain-containing protein n=1 Tax=Roseivirga sp. TaxID=1964215 RepID=UPI003B8CDB2B